MDLWAECSQYIQRMIFAQSESHATPRKKREKAAKDAENKLFCERKKFSKGPNLLYNIIVKNKKNKIIFYMILIFGGKKVYDTKICSL